MVGAQFRGLDVASFDLLNPGQIVDYCMEYNAQLNGVADDGGVRTATQADFDNF